MTSPPKESWCQTAPRNNFAPRLGLAWRPVGPNTVVRAGFGMFYGMVSRAAAAGGVPFVINERSLTNDTPVPTLLFPRIYPASSGAGPTTITLPQPIRKDLRDPFSTLEHQRWSTSFHATYIGTNTRQG